MPAAPHVDGPRGVIRRRRVLFLPEDPNPYQRLLAGALAAEGFDVLMGPNPRREPLPILRAWLLRGRPRLVHLHWTHRYLGRSAGGPSRLQRWRFLGQLWLLQRLGVRLVWTIHNLGRHDAVRSTRETQVHRSLAHRVDALICHCEAAAELAAGTWSLAGADRDRIRIVAHGSYAGAYPVGPGRGAARETLGLPADARVFLFLGQVKGYKGVAELLDSFGGLEAPDARLVIAGAAAVELDALIRDRASADPRIVARLGYVPDAQLGVLLDAADAVVLPFRDILTSGSAILALTFGRPIVAPRMGCLPELVDERAAILYSPEAPDGLGDALQRSLTADLDDLGRGARQIAAGLDWAPIGAATAQIYRG